MSTKIAMIMHKLGIVNLPVTFNIAVTVVAMHSNIFEPSDLYRGNLGEAARTDTTSAKQRLQSMSRRADLGNASFERHRMTQSTHLQK